MRAEIQRRLAGTSCASASFAEAQISARFLPRSRLCRSSGLRAAARSRRALASTSARSPGERRPRLAPARQAAADRRGGGIGHEHGRTRLATPFATILTSVNPGARRCRLRRRCHIPFTHCDRAMPGVGTALSLRFLAWPHADIRQPQGAGHARDHSATTPARPQLAAAALSSLRSEDRQEDDRASRRVADNLRLLTERLAPRRRVVHAGDVVFAAGDRFDTLYVLTSGFFKMVNLAADGREQVVSLKFRGDWLGFDGIAAGSYSCDAVAMDTGEVLAIRYDQLLSASVACPALLDHAARGDEPRDRPRPRFADVGVHPARRRARRRVPALLGRLARQERPALRPDHAAHDPRRDRQLPRHDARDGEPRACRSWPAATSSPSPRRGGATSASPTSPPCRASSSAASSRARPRCSRRAPAPPQAAPITREIAAPAPRGCRACAAAPRSAANRGPRPGARPSSPT